jgi:hypothetical protein
MLELETERIHVNVEISRNNGRIFISSKVISHFPFLVCDIDILNFPPIFCLFREIGSKSQIEDMADHRIQFRDEIHPVKTSNSRVHPIEKSSPSIIEKEASYDEEEKALRIANEDLNRKKKQVSTYS